MSDGNGNGEPKSTTTAKAPTATTPLEERVAEIGRQVKERTTALLDAMEAAKIPHDGISFIAILSLAGKVGSQYALLPDAVAHFIRRWQDGQAQIVTEIITDALLEHMLTEVECPGRPS